MATALRVRSHALGSSDDPAAERSAARAALPLPRPGTLGALALSAIVIAAFAVARSPLVMTSSVGPVAMQSAGGRLELSAAYVAFAPICNVFDAFTLLSLSQHGAILAWAIAVVFVWRGWRSTRARKSRSVPRQCAREGACLAGAVVAALTFYATGALVPRPMATLALANPDDLAVDVHSHTEASHDGRPGFDADANRRWHAGAGFDAVYVTDHRGYEGAASAVRGNAPRAGDGIVLLPGIESRYGGMHVTVLGATVADSVDRKGTLDVARLQQLASRAQASRSAAPGLVTVLTMPGPLHQIPPELSFAAVELSDGAPRGLEFTRRHEVALRRLARERGAMPVAGSNNHGWGNTATAWTVMRLPDWRAMTPSQLDLAIRGAIIRGDSSIRIVERVAPPLPRDLGMWLATPALLGWQIAAHMTPPERLAWLGWIWGLWAAARLLAWRPARVRAPLELSPRLGLHLEHE